MLYSYINHKVYYPYLDLLKFVCCIGIVVIHTQPHSDLPEWGGKIVEKIISLPVPIFFMLSSYLFAGKIRFAAGDGIHIKKFVKRLLILYLLWTVLLVWSWLPPFVNTFSDDWLTYLPLRFICGAPLGSWFIVSLIYGMLVVYACNRWLGKCITTFLFVGIELYFRIVQGGLLPDTLGIDYKGEIFSTALSPLVALAPIQIGLLLRLVRQNFLIERILRIKFILILTLLTIYVLMGSYSFCVALLVQAVIILCCAVGYDSRHPYSGYDYSMLRKMSIIVYFTHFVICQLFNYMGVRGYIDYTMGFPVFVTALVFCCAVSYVIVLCSERYNWMKYLY